MQVGTYSDGRSVSYDDGTGQFWTAAGVVGIGELLCMEDQGLLTWSTPETRLWARSLPSVTQVAPDAGRPAVVVWFRVYSAFLCLMYVGAIGFGFVLMQASSPFDAAVAEDPVISAIPALALVIPGFAFLAAFAASFMLPRRGWVWVYDLVLICVGFTSTLTLVPCVFMLIAWLKPEVKHYFGRA